MNKNVFEFTNDKGEKRYADPMRVWRVLNAGLGGDIHGAVGLAMQEEEQALPGVQHEKLLATICQAFGLRAFDPKTGEGATEELLLDVFDSFWDFQAQKKTTPESGQTGPPSSESPSPKSTPPTTDSSSGCP